MIGNFSAKIVDKLIEKDIIGLDDYELYHYGFFIIISECFLAIFCMLIGMIFGIFIQSILFYITFFAFHRFAGGFHAKTEFKCQAITLSSFSLCLLGIRFVNIADNRFLIIAFVITCIAMILLSPADTPEKILTKEEKRKFKIYTMILSCVFLLIATVLYICQNSDLICAVFFGALLELISVVFGRLLNHKSIAEKI